MTGPWRLGNRNPNNLYRGEQHEGMLIDPGHAEAIVAAMNGADASEWHACCDHRALQLDRLREEREAGMADAGRLIAEALRERGLHDEARFVTDYARCGFPRPDGADERGAPL